MRTTQNILGCVSIDYTSCYQNWGGHILYFKFSSGYEEAMAYRIAKDQYLSPFLWKCLTCEVFIRIYLSRLAQNGKPGFLRYNF